MLCSFPETLRLWDIGLYRPFIWRTENIFRDSDQIPCFSPQVCPERGLCCAVMSNVFTKFLSRVETMRLEAISLQAFLIPLNLRDDICNDLY